MTAALFINKENSAAALFYNIAWFLLTATFIALL